MSSPSPSPQELLFSDPPSPDPQEALGQDSSKPSPSTPPQEDQPCEVSSISSPTPPPAAQITSQEARKIESLKARITALETQIQETQEKQMELDAKIKTKNPQAIVKAHINLLHDYNEIRDIGQGLMGMVAEKNGVRIRDVYEDYGVGEGD